MNGNGLIGSVPLGGAGNFERDFRTIVEGCIHYVTIRINFAGTAGSSFALVVTTSPTAAAEGGDDLDKVLGNGATGLFGFTSFRLDGQNWLWQNLTFPQLRTIFGALMNGADFGGTFVNGATQAVASTPWRIELNVPISLETWFVDGNSTAQGSERMRAGTFQVVNLAPASVVLANGTMTISTAASVALESIGGIGDPFQLGPTWHGERTLNFPNKVELAMAPRMLLLDVQPTPTNPAAESGYTVTGQERFDLVGASFFGNRFKATRLMQGGYDITQRCTPLLFIRPGMQILELPTPSAPTVAVPSVTTLGFYDVQFVPRGEAITTRVAQLAGSGGPVNQVHPSPRSLTPGTRVPAAAAPYLPVVFTQKPVAGPGVTSATTPNAAGARTGQRLNLLQMLAAARK